MPYIQKWCDEAVVVHWEQADSNLPDAVEAHCCMVETSHFTRMSTPSTAHLERRIPEPSSPDIKGLPLRPRKKTEH